MQSFLIRGLALLAGAAMSGCGTGVEQFPVAPTSGQVLCEGTPLPEAQVFFAPVAKSDKEAKSGKQGFAFTDNDGRFVISTYGNRDGAVVGKHSVRVWGSSKIPCDCIASDSREVLQAEVKEGIENTFEIKLPKKTGRERPVRASDEEE